MPKNIVLCCDGTGNEYGARMTNVVKFYSALVKDERQLAFYDPGVGTMPAPNVLSKISKRLTTWAGLAFGYGITQNIEDAYRYLMQTYEAGDEVFIVGFSRGAYTARAVAAMLFKVGLLFPGHGQLVPYAMKIFKYERDVEIYKGFRRTFARRCPVRLLGLWDTVASLGWVYDPFSLQFTADNPAVRIVRHAVSIDERRMFYRQNLWGKGRDYQDIRQVWFAGVHGDVGGVYPADESGPARIALQWMIEQARTAGVEFDDRKLTRVLPPGSVTVAAPRLHQSLYGLWWLPEYLLPKPYKDPQDNFKTKLKFYRGARRYIGEGAVLHRSVLDRKATQAYDPPNLPQSFTVEPW